MPTSICEGLAESWVRSTKVEAMLTMTKRAELAFLVTVRASELILVWFQFAGKQVGASAGHLVGRRSGAGMRRS